MDKKLYQRLRGELLYYRIPGKVSMDHEVGGQGRLKGNLHTLDGFGSLRKNITMPSGPITRGRAKRL